MTLTRYGSKNWMLHWESRKALEKISPTLFHALEKAPPQHLCEFVPGYQTLLLLFDRSTDEDRLKKYLDPILQQDATGKREARVIPIPVCYQGEDLPAFAAACRLSISEVIRKHSSPVYEVYFMGFSPGFPYLGPLDPALHLARRESPRPRISAGSVAIGGSHTGIYSIDSPGGWHIIGHTNHPLFQVEAARCDSPDASDVFSLKPGDRVQFIATDSLDT